MFLTSVYHRQNGNSLTELSSGRGAVTRLEAVVAKIPKRTPKEYEGTSHSSYHSCCRGNSRRNSLKMHTAKFPLRNSCGAPYGLLPFRTPLSRRDAVRYTVLRVGQRAVVADQGPSAVRPHGHAFFVCSLGSSLLNPGLYR